MAERPTLLILGAGIDQSYPIRVARKEGLRVLTADINPAAPSFELADEAAIVSNRDLDGLKKMCDKSASRGFPVKGVLVMGCDIPHIAAELAVYLGIPGPSIETGVLTTNKFLMKERLSQAGVAVPWYAKVASVNNLRKIISEHGGKKFVIKPVDRSGARGVFLIQSDSNKLDSLYENSKLESYIGEVQVEEYIPGHQISTETICWEGKIFTPGFVDRNYEMMARFSPLFIENGGTHPSKIQGETRKRIEELVGKAAKALGILNGIAKGDVVIAPDGSPMIIEIAARLSGGDFSESLIPLGTGVNIVQAAIRMAIGKPPNIKRIKGRRERIIANRYFFGEEGLLTAIIGLEKARSLPWVHKLEVHVKPGDLIRSTKHHGDRLGVFVIEADDEVQLEKRIIQIYELVRFEITK